MPLEFGVRRIPSVTLSIALGTQSVSIAIIIKLLGDIPGTDFPDSLITVMGKPIVAIESYI